MMAEFLDKKFGVLQYICSNVDYEYCERAHNCGDKSYERYNDPSEYNNRAHEYEDGSYKVYNGPCDHRDKTLEYDGESYGSNDSLNDSEWHGGEDYYSRDEHEVNGAYGSCNDVKGVEEPCSEYYSKGEGYVSSHTSHHGYEGVVGYNMVSYICYEHI